jgi:hypothetical protein
MRTLDVHQLLLPGFVRKLNPLTYDQVFRTCTKNL